MTETQNTPFINYNSNFDPAQIATATSMVIQFVVIIDISPSIHDYVDEMNKALRDLFMLEFKESHRKNDILIKCITFCEKVEDKSGFLPIVNLQDDYLSVAPTGRGTALFDAVNSGLKQAISYREDLEDQGIDVRTSIFIITDGADNASKRESSKEISETLDLLRKNEGWANSFTVTMLGIGNSVVFENACDTMGLSRKALVTTQDTAKDMRKIIGVVSQSVSSSNQQQTISF